jgi:hypothetical protein
VALWLCAKNNWHRPDRIAPWMLKRVQHDEAGEVGVARPAPPRALKLGFPTLFRGHSLLAMVTAILPVPALRLAPGFGRRGSETRGVRGVTFVTFRIKSRRIAMPPASPRAPILHCRRICLIGAPEKETAP